MTIRDRIRAVYRGEVPDAVPFMVDSQHWFAHRHSLPWDLSQSHENPQLDVIEWHRRMGIGF